MGRTFEDLIGKLVNVIDKNGARRYLRVLKVRMTTKTLKTKEGKNTVSKPVPALKEITAGHWPHHAWRCLRKGCKRRFGTNQLEWASDDGNGKPIAPSAVNEHIEETGHKVTYQRLQEKEVVQAKHILFVWWRMKDVPLDKWLED